MSEKSEPVLELIDADIPRAQVPASAPVVRGVSWRVSAGEFWAVGAFAGTGKTDLLSTAAGLQRPLAGRYLLFGKDTSQMHEDELVLKRLKVGMVFDSGRLFNDLTVAENIALPLRYHHEGNKAAITEATNLALSITVLEEFRDQLPREIPRPLHQRIALARALALSPEALLIDNPLSGVDFRQARWWIDFLSEMNRGHAKFQHPLTIVVATDDLRPWTDTAAQFAVLKEKRFERVGGRDQIKLTSEPLVRDLLMQDFDGS